MVQCSTNIEPSSINREKPDRVFFAQFPEEKKAAWLVERVSRCMGNGVETQVGQLNKSTKAVDDRHDSLVRHIHDWEVVMRHEDACLGVSVRLLSDWHGIPKGTVGSIDSVEAGRDGLWCFTVFWELHRPLRSMMRGHARMHTGLQSGSLGLRLWEEDLPRFEVITQEQKALATLHVAGLDDTTPAILCLFTSDDAEQLRLPFTEHELVEDEQPQLAYAAAGADA